MGWLVFLRPSLFGGPAHYVIVTGSSMEPVLHGGDLVVALTEPSYSVGDLVVYRLPASAAQYIPSDGRYAGRLIVHRIVGGDPETGFQLEGDNAAHADFWTVGVDDIAGRVTITVPAGGRLLIFLRNPLILASLAAGFAFVFAVWPSGKRPPRAEALPQVG